METLAAAIRQNIARVNERIYLAAQSAKRRPEAVRLVVVTKGQPVEVILAVVEAGASILGENYPEETLPKIQALAAAQGSVSAPEWHMIGHLQSRKAGIVAAHFDLLHSLDSLSLALKLNRLLAGAHRRLPVLLEVNVGGEATKSGWAGAEDSQWDLLRSEFEQILSLPNLQVAGLMTMPPLNVDPEQTRPYFVRLRRLSETLAARYGSDHFSELSMGTSADYPAAVQEGATYVRVGTAIVGPRPKKGG